MNVRTLFCAHGPLPGTLDLFKVKLCLFMFSERGSGALGAFREPDRLSDVGGALSKIRL